MKLEQTPSDYLQEVKKDKLKQLMAIAIDIAYWKDVLAEGDEDKLRKELEKENRKRVIDKRGQLLKDDRDLDKIQELSTRIEQAVKATEQIKNLTSMDIQIRKYIKHVESPKDDVIATLNKVANL